MGPGSEPDFNTVPWDDTHFRQEEVRSAAKCEVRTGLDGKLRCELPAGHAGAHMHFGTNGTTAWGGMSTLYRLRNLG